MKLKFKIAFATLGLVGLSAQAQEFPASADLSIPYVRNTFQVHPHVRDTLLFVEDSGFGEGARAYRYQAVTDEAKDYLQTLQLKTAYICGFKNLAVPYPNGTGFQFNAANCKEVKK